MNWLGRVWKRRKQSDRVKIMLLFYICSLFFLGRTVFTGIKLYQVISERQEYVLSCEAENGITNEQIRELYKHKGILSVGLQKETSVSFGGAWGEIVLPCICLSGEYMEQVYGVKEQGAMPTFYLDEAAYKAYKKSADIGEQEDGRLQTMYTMEAEEEKEPDRGTARLLLLKGRENGNFAYYVDKRGSKLALAEELRVWVQGLDLDGQRLEYFEGQGFQVKNEMEYVQDMLKLEGGIARFKYELVIALLFIVAARCLKR